MKDQPESFDAYHRWLGISPKDQPPNHYQVVLYDGRQAAVCLLGPIARLTMWIAVALVFLFSERIVAEVFLRFGSGYAVEPRGGAFLVLRLVFALLAVVGWILLARAGWRFGKAVWRHRGLRYVLTTQQIEVERGIFIKSTVTLELWRVKDLVYVRSFGEFLLGVGRIHVLATDPTVDEIRVGPIRDARAIYSQLKQAWLAIGQRARTPASGGR